jgi:hypothetical protein
VEPPELPAEVPADLRDFVECRATSVTVRDGPQAWVTLPDQATAFVPKASKPELRTTPGSAAGSATVEVRVAFVAVRLSATVTAGTLSIDTSGLPWWAPASIRTGVDGWVERLNAWFASNGKGLAPPEFGSGEVTLRKVPRGTTGE